MGTMPGHALAGQMTAPDRHLAHGVHRQRPNHVVEEYERTVYQIFFFFNCVTRDGS